MFTKENLVRVRDDKLFSGEVYQAVAQMIHMNTRGTPI